jgi:hypothetical protein
MTLFRKGGMRNPALWILLPAAFAVRIYSVDAHRVEDGYSRGVYPHIAGFLRSLTGKAPVSLGDILYLILVVGLVVSLLQGIGIWRERGWKGLLQAGALPKALTFLLAVYVVFNLAWGLNYDRLGIAHQLELPLRDTDTTGMAAMADELLQQTNRYASASERLRSVGSPELVGRTVEAYEKAATVLPFLSYHAPSVKASLYGSIGNHLGYTGYYNPFTAEAQLNDAIPHVLKPFVLCHEVAHQLGYARESEANFVGFLAARSSNDSLLLYSAFFDMFLYTNGALFAMDSVRARQNLKRLDTSARRDLKELREFRLRYQGPVERVIDAVYDRFLKWNRQPQGRASYSQVVQWLLAYRRKNGSL